MLSSGRKDIRPPPIMPGMLHMKIQAQRWEAWRIPMPTRRVNAMLTIPDGVFRRAACGGGKPKFLMSVEE